MVSVTKKYQVTIPKQIRADLGIKAGDKVVFLKADDGYKITRAKDIIKAGIEIFKDVYVTVKETKEGLGKGPSEYARDYMIGSLAVKLKCPLITSNINDFEWMEEKFLFTPEKFFERLI